MGSPKLKPATTPKPIRKILHEKDDAVEVVSSENSVSFAVQEQEQDANDTSGDRVQQARWNRKLSVTVSRRPSMRDRVGHGGEALGTDPFAENSGSRIVGNAVTLSRKPSTPSNVTTMASIRRKSETSDKTFNQPNLQGAKPEDKLLSAENEHPSQLSSYASAYQQKTKRPSFNVDLVQKTTPSFGRNLSHESYSGLQHKKASLDSISLTGRDGYVSVRKRANNIKSASYTHIGLDVKESKEKMDDASSYGGIKQHPIIQWMLEIQSRIMESIWFQRLITVLASDRARIILYLAVMLLMHSTMIVLFIITLTAIMPGIWVYNFIQVFVIGCTLIAHWASDKLSNIIRTSIAAGDLVRGRLTMPQVADYWTHGPRSPAHRIIFVSAFIELLADIIVVCSGISFIWEEEMTLVMVGTCQPPSYNGSSLPDGITIQQFLQGDMDYAEVYNYGLPLADGLVGGWAGWPLNDPLRAFQIISEGPVYVIQVLCDNGLRSPLMEYGTGTHLDSRIVESDDRSLFLEISTTFPPGSTWDDINGHLVEHSLVQTCAVLITVSHGRLAYQFQTDQWQTVTNGQLRFAETADKSYLTKFPSSINQYTTDAQAAFKNFEDVYGFLPLVTEAVELVVTNMTYYPSQGATFCNFLSEGTLSDGYYHTSGTYRGVATGE
ncbi:hypothetical protein HDU81_001268 [Chytriomyces hyalinus]|nr:hypothetical protein HDU81_001268 [Chytriomyces hyalinus]